MALAQTAARFGQRPSALIGITSNVLALDFDITCNYRLVLLEIERQQKQIEAMETGGESREQVKGRITKDTLRW